MLFRSGIVGLIFSLFAGLYKVRTQQVKRQKRELELLVKMRTEELQRINEELKSTNDELYNQREELNLMLEKLQKAQNQIVQSEKLASLGLLAAGVAHEINNPLNFIQGGILAIENFVKDNLKNYYNDFLPMFKIIYSGITRAAGIITSLNHYSRRDDTKTVESNIHTIIDNCLLMLNNQIKDRVKVERDYTKQQFSFSCNEGKMHQALLNILSNADQSIDGKGTISIKTKVKENTLVIVVADTGCGIPKENLPRITDPFFTTKDPGKGTGLGLSITLNIIEEHNGKLEFESEVGKGTKVFVNLPLGE